MRKANGGRQKRIRIAVYLFKDPTFTGFNTMDQFLHHIEHDSLVKHSFTYGVKPPLSHPDFVSKVREWVNKGAALPDK